MSKNDSYFIPHMEWEAVKFPVVLQEVEFRDLNVDFGKGAKATVWRDEHLHLKGKLSGRLRNLAPLNQIQFIGKGNIIKQDILKGVDVEGNVVMLSGCVLGGFQTNSYTVNEEGYFFEVELIFDTVQISFVSNQQKPVQAQSIHFEWYLCEHINPHFWGSTVRCLQAPNKKVRVGIDAYNDENTNFLDTSTAKDFFLLETVEFSCIIAKVPEALIGNGMEGLCLEFRDLHIAMVDKDLLADLSSFLSFMLGSKLYYMGNSRLKDGILLEALLDNPNLPIEGQPAIPPIKYNLQHKWGDFALQMNLLFPVYRRQQHLLSLNHAISRFWIAQQIPVGVNLPILAGAIEIIAGKYLEMTGHKKLEYLSQTVYDEMIEEELNSLRAKLLPIEGGEIMMSKITGAFRKGSNEKINFFFSILGLDTGKAEKSAISLRNKMTHSKRDYSKDDTFYDDLILTRVYQLLFNRIILKITGYDGYYIDYSLERCPSKPINMKAGEIN